MGSGTGSDFWGKGIKRPERAGRDQASDAHDIARIIEKEKTAVATKR